MAKLPDDTLTTIFTLQRRLAEGIEEASATAPAAMLNLLAQTIDQTQATVAASEASVRESKRNWNLP